MSHCHCLIFYYVFPGTCFVFVTSSYTYALIKYLVTTVLLSSLPYTSTMSYVQCTQSHGVNYAGQQFQRKEKNEKKGKKQSSPPPPSPPGRDKRVRRCGKNRVIVCVCSLCMLPIHLFKRGKKKSIELKRERTKGFPANYK